MGLEQNNEQHYREVVDKFVDINEDYQMSTRDYVVRPSAHDPLNQAIALTLPPVAEAVGRFYSIISRGADAVNTITIHDRHDSECWTADIVMNSKCDRVLMYSDGLCWHALTSESVGDWPGQTTRAPGTARPTTLAPTTLGQTTEAPTTAP
jgi:hypothetical protein